MENCVILAGGKSSRMGQDKTLLPFGDSPTLTHFQFDKFSKIFRQVFISSKIDKFSPTLPIIRDVELNLTLPSDSLKMANGTPQTRQKSDDFSPMLALFSILCSFKNKHVFIIPADMPFVSEKTIRELYQFTNEFDIVIAQDSSHTHSLCGFYSSNVAQKAKELYENGEHKIGLLQIYHSCKKVRFESQKEFFNINYPAEYENAIKGNI